MSHPYLSVIIPIYNAEENLPRLLDSLLNQTFRDFEIICVDNGSTDQSISIIQRYARSDRRIRSEHEAQQGAAAARNKGLRVASGAYVIFFDADDHCPSTESLYRLTAAAQESGSNVVRGNPLKHFEETNELLRVEFFGVDLFLEESGAITWLEQPALWVPWFHQVYLIRREFLLERGINYPNLLRGQDPPFLLRILLASREIYCIPDVVYVYRTSKEKWRQFKWSETSAEHYLKHYLDIRNQYLTHQLPKQWKVYALHAARKLNQLLPVAISSRSPEITRLILDIFSDLWDYRDLNIEPFKETLPWDLVFLSLLQCHKLQNGCVPSQRKTQIMGTDTLVPKRRTRGHATGPGNFFLPNENSKPPKRTDHPIVSVIVPVYRTEQYLARCLDSILSQTMQDLEVIVVNDCSPDNSELIIQSFAKKDSRVVYLKHEKNLGLGGARNTGLAAAKGTFIASVDSDDFIASNALEQVVARCQQDRTDVAVFSACDFIEETGMIEASAFYNLRDFPRILQIDGKNIGTLFPTFQLKVYKRVLLEKVDAEFPDHLYHEDDEFFWKFFSCALPRISVIKENLYYRTRRADESSIMNNLRLSRKDMPQILTNAYRFMIERKTFSNVRRAFVERVCKNIYVITYIEHEHREAAFSTMSRLLSELQPTEQEIPLGVSVREVREVEKGNYVGLLNIRVDKLAQRNKSLQNNFLGHELFDPLNISRSLLQRQLNEIYASTSWRITFPMRWLKIKMRKIIK